jgi:hypothetical protein
MSNGRWQWLSGAHRSTAHSAPPTAVRGTTGTGSEQAIPEFEFSGGEECRGMRVLVTATATGARARSSRAAAKLLALALGGASGCWLLGAGGWGLGVGRADAGAAALRLSRYLPTDQRSPSPTHPRQREDFFDFLLPPLPRESSFRVHALQTNTSSVHVQQPFSH